MGKVTAEEIEGFAERGDDQAIVALAERLAKPGEAGEAAAYVEAAISRLGVSNARIQGGCIKLLYEIGFRNPERISGHSEEFLRLLTSRNNRLVWGGMSAIAAIASLESAALFERREEILAAIRSGSVITQDRGIAALGIVAAADPRYRENLMKSLLGFIKSCRASDVAKFAESVRPAVDSSSSAAYRRILEARLGELAPAARKRVEKLLRGLTA
jgi:hypothetical protein